MDITIKLEKNIEIITRLNKEVHTLHQKKHPDIFKPYNYEIMYKMFDEILRKDSSHSFIIYIAQKPVGYAILIERDYNVPLFQDSYKAMYIDQMCVIEAHRFKGLGTQLMGKIQEFCKQHDYKRIELGVWADNMNAINFYKKIGFEDYLIHMCLAI